MQVNRFCVKELVLRGALGAGTVKYYFGRGVPLPFFFE